MSDARSALHHVFDNHNHSRTKTKRPVAHLFPFFHPSHPIVITRTPTTALIDASETPR